jgi:hypothetical protein
MATSGKANGYFLAYGRLKRRFKGRFSPEIPLKSDSSSAT